MIIRKATVADSSAITKCLFIAMDEILHHFIGQTDSNAATKFLLHFVAQTQNQYSWENCHVGEYNNEVVCAINIYSGADLEILRKPIIDFVRQQYNANFDPENETQTGEFYVDSFGVNPDYQGRGFGSLMLQNAIQRFVTDGNQTLGLLVDVDNPNAKKLYTKMGFKSVGFKTLAGKTLEHLQIFPYSF